MPKCYYCGKEFDYEDAESTYASDETINEYGLDEAYSTFMEPICGHCAIEQALAGYVQGAEDLSMSGWDD